MAFDRSNLHLVAQGQKKLFLYTTTDAIGTVVGAGYFLGDYEKFNEGDVIIAHTSSGGTDAIDVLVILTASSAGVTVANGT